MYVKKRKQFITHVPLGDRLPKVGDQALADLLTKNERKTGTELLVEIKEINEIEWLLRPNSRPKLKVTYTAEYEITKKPPVQLL